MMRLRAGRRIVWLSAVILVVLMALGGRLYDLQMLRGAEYSRIAYQQRTLSLPLGDRRGAVLDRYGAPLTDSQQGWGVAVFPPQVTDPQGLARTLAPLIGVDESAILAAVEGKRLPVWLSRTVRPARALTVQQLGLSGVAVGPTEDRYGPAALARHLVGYVNQAGGQLGLEKAFEADLTGDAVPVLTTDLTGKGTPMSGHSIRATLPTAGKQPYTLQTTIDARIQMAVEEVLDEHQYRGAAVVLEPDSGEVLAMASRPQFSYDFLAAALKDQRGTPLIDRAVAAYEPGSVFKAIIAAAALDQGKVDLDERFYCPGHYAIGNHTFSDFDGKGHGWITFRDAVAVSCNVTFLQVGYERLGLDGMEAAARKFGFGSPTGLFGRPWADEQAGTVPDLGDTGAVQMAFGQGSLTVTPLQIARAYAAIANGGTLPALKLIAAIKNPAGQVVERPAAGKATRVMARSSAAQLQKALALVTDPGGRGTGKGAWVEDGGSAGKTGSAEWKKGEPTHAWFAGWVPLVRPRYVIVVFAEGAGGGGAVAAPIFRAIGERIAALK